MSEQEIPTAYAKVEGVNYNIGDPFPEVNFCPPVREDSLLCSIEGFQRQVDEFRKAYPDKNEMRLYFMRYMTDDEIVRFEKSDKRDHIDTDTLREMINKIRANTNTTKGA
jgi:hypothetical protein